jgi:hypothetical protein
MIEQNYNKLTLTFPSEASATTFAAFLQSLLQPSPAPGIFEPPSGQPLETQPDSQEQTSSRRTVLTPERQEALFNQRQNGQSAHQRILRAQTTLKDGVLPFSKPGQAPQPSGQPSPRQRAAAEGTFADGVAVPQEVKAKSKLRPSQSSLPPSRS